MFVTKEMERTFEHAKSIRRASLNLEGRARLLAEVWFHKAIARYLTMRIERYDVFADEAGLSPALRSLRQNDYLLLMQENELIIKLKVILKII